MSASGPDNHQELIQQLAQVLVKDSCIFVLPLIIRSGKRLKLKGKFQLAVHRVQNKCGQHFRQQ